jgi:hypothetical protein
MDFKLLVKKLRNCHLLILGMKLHNSHFYRLQKTRKLRNSHFHCLQRTRKLGLVTQSSPYNTIYQNLGLYKTNTRSDPTRSRSAMSAPALHAQSHMRACKIESYEEEDEVYNREKLLVRPNNLIFMKDDVPANFVFDKPFFTSAQLFKRPFFTQETP